MRPTVLLVDDYPDAVELLGIYLDVAGYGVVTAHDGYAALDQARAQRIDAVVLDLEMPGMSGVEVARQLRLQPDMATVPVIAVTGHSGAKHRDAARDAGCDALLVKPYDPDELLATIRRLLEAAPARP